MEESHWKELVKTCENEKLHLSGHIQGHGYLLHVDSESGKVLHASENCETAFDMSLQELFGTPVSDLLSEGILFRVNSDLKKGEKVFLESAMTLESVGRLHASISKTSGKNRIVELWAENREMSVGGDYEKIMPRTPLNHPMEDIYEECNILCKKIRKSTELDRVLIYRFTDTWDGEVLAQEGEGMGDFLGLRFPATDIPKIARDLYMLNNYRAIPNVQSEPVPIRASLSEQEGLDLTYSDLRSVSPVHIQYLKNMEVGASFSFSVKVNGRLWGLVTLHHKSKAYLPVSLLRHCAESINEFGLRASVLTTNQKMNFIDRVDYQARELFKKISDSENLESGLENEGDDILNFLGANGAVVRFGDHRVLLGKVPPEKDLDRLNLWVFNGERQIAHSDKISSEIPEMEGQINTCGVMGVGVTASAKKKTRKIGASVLWFRPEFKTTVKWGGAPEKKVEKIAGREVLSPRSSFTQWKEVTKNQSIPWSQQDIIAAQKFRATILERLTDINP